MAEEKAPKTTERKVPKVTKKYTGLSGGEYGGLGGEHGSLKIPDSGSYETSDPVEQAYIENVLGVEASK